MTYLLLLATLLVTPSAAWAHWSIVSELTAAEAGRTFQLTLHYEILAGQSNPDELLTICFWVERHEENRYAEFTRRACRPVTLRPNDWLTLTYSVGSLPRVANQASGGLPAGQYRAIAMIQSDVNPVVKFFLGAAQDRKVLPFRIE